MMKPMFLYLFLAGVLASCSNSAEEFELAAKELCSCMEDGQADAENAASAGVNIGFCLLDAEVDLKAPEMKEQINMQCPEFNEGFADYVKELK
jgi:hypothetical protein